ncbi:MAG: hypothetical protein ABH864_02590 [archaeon]
MKKIWWVFIAAIILLLILGGYVLRNILSSATSGPAAIDPESRRDIVDLFNDEGKLRVCPDEWYDNQMPCSCEGDDCSGCNDVPSQYFIVNGERMELSEFDIDWIDENCDLEPMVVV